MSAVGYGVEYYLDKWVRPIIPHSKLFVFDNLADARNFARIMGDVVFECEVENPSVGKWSFGRDMSIEEFWEIMSTGNVPAGSSLNLSGTYYVDAVKLIREVSFG